VSAGHLKVRKDPTCQQVEREARNHMLAEVVLTGLYER
jgi:hypothetical protein